MNIGLKRNTVILEAHKAEWETMAHQTIRDLKTVLGEAAIDIQHVGSTSIQSIPAKPILDIAVGMSNPEDALVRAKELEQIGIVFAHAESTGQLLFVAGDIENHILTHHIHAVTYGSRNWCDYINFRDYLNAHETMAKEYSELKMGLQARFANDRAQYTAGKHAFIARILTQARAWRAAQCGTDEGGSLCRQ